MKLTKNEIARVDKYWHIVQTFMWDKLPERHALIKYGYCVGVIHQIIHGRIYWSDKDLVKNNNADAYLLENFGQDFLDWMSGGHRKFSFDVNKKTDDDTFTYVTSAEVKENKLKELIKSLNIKG